MGNEAKSITNWLVDLDFLGLWIPGMLFVILEIVYIALCQGSLTFFKDCMGIEYLIPFLVVSYIVGCALQSLRIMMRLKLPLKFPHPLRRPSSGVKEDNFFCESEWTIHKQLKDEFVSGLHIQNTVGITAEAGVQIADGTQANTQTDTKDGEEDKMVVNFYEAYLQQTENGGFERSFRLMSLISLDYQTALALFLTAFLGLLQLLLVVVCPAMKGFFGVGTNAQPSFSYVFVLVVASLITGLLLMQRADWFTRYRTRFICRQVFIHKWRIEQDKRHDANTGTAS